MKSFGAITLQIRSTHIVLMDSNSLKKMVPVILCRKYVLLTRQWETRPNLLAICRADLQTIE